MKNIVKNFIRRKPIEVDEQSSQLKRCLNTFDLTALGVGASLGQAVYIIIGQVVSRKSGPSVIFSFAIAGIAAILSAMCFAEFASIAPKAGSAYIYAYVTVGELVAFAIGWNLSLEYLVGSATSARGLSEYLDGFLDGIISNYSTQIMPINIPYCSPYFDLVSFTVIMLVAIIIAIGVQESIGLIKIFTAINIYATIFIILCGIWIIDWSNWNLAASSIPKGYGIGGYFPYGIGGMLSGAGTAFWAFIGFDCIATTGEEAENPKKTVPRSIFSCVAIVGITLMIASFVASLDVPYYVQDTASPWDVIFRSVGWSGFPILIITAGAITSLLSAVFGSLHPLPRIFYAMSNDGLLFPLFGKVNSRTKTPFLSVIISGLQASFLAAFFESRDLADLGSIGTLLVYAIVAGAILVLRYHDISGTDAERLCSQDIFPRTRLDRFFLKYLKCVTSSELTAFLLKSIYVTLILLVFMLFIMQDFLPNSFLVLALCIILAIIAIALVTVLSYQPPKRVYGSRDYMAPLVPYIPCLSIFCNLYLMSRLPLLTWMRFLVWTLFGGMIYFFYGMRNSVGFKKESEKLTTLSDKYFSTKSYGSLG